jgi:hypothetical protein
MARGGLGRVGVPAVLVGSGRALRAGVAERIQHLRDRARRGLRRATGRRVFASDLKSAPAGVRVGKILHPAVLLAFPDGAGFLQD